jgi:hypothetical protein
LDGIASTTETTISILMQHDIREWLKPPDPKSDYPRARELHLAGTGQWLLQNPAFLSWKKMSKGAMWLHGATGCGRTILSSTVIATLQAEEEQKSARGNALIHFFFSSTDIAEQTEQCVRSLIYQVSQQVPSAAAALADSYHASKENGQLLSWEGLVQALKALISRCSQVRVVLDALDECQRRDVLLEWLDDLMTVDNTAIILTSRFEHDIGEALQRKILRNYTIAINSARVDEDIAKYVSHRLTHDRAFRWFDAQSSDEKLFITAALSKKADGMFVNYMWSL